MMALASLFHRDERPGLRRDGGANASVVTLPSLVSQDMRHGISVLGNFDGVHRGHRKLMEVANELAAGAHCPIVAMSAEPHPVTFFKRGPKRFRLTCTQTKLGLLSRYGVDVVYSPDFDARFAAMTPDEFVKLVLVDALGTRHVVVGDDFHFGARRSGNVEVLSDLAASRGIIVTVVPEVLVCGKRCSSSNIRAFIAEGDLSRASEMLGYAWHFLAEAKRRDSRAWLLSPSEDLLQPARGVYEVRVITNTSPEIAFEGLLFVEDDSMILKAPRAIPGLQFSGFVVEMPHSKL